ncbi:hypothetical protein BH10PLA1_BH10PLA1_11810 [soil metagenome]
MIDEQFEFRLSQYLDGMLPVDEAAAFFEELAKNPAAMATLDEYRKLDLMLKAQPSEAINWDGLAEDISAQIDEDSRLRLRAASWFRQPMRIAMAASVLIAVGVAGWITLHRSNATGPAAPVAVARITGPVAEVADAAAVTEIQIGPGAPTTAEQAMSLHYAELTPRPARIVIASGVAARQDERLMPF